MNTLDNAMGELTSVLERCQYLQFDHSQDDNLGTRIRLALHSLYPLNFHSCTGEVKIRIFEVINSINQIINFRLHLSKEKADHIRDQLLNVGNKLRQESSRYPKPGGLQPKIVETQKMLFEAMKPTSIHQSKIDCKIAYFCDIDFTDWNGAILTGVSDILQNPMPFITSLSILNGAFITTGKTDVIGKVRNLLKDHQYEWDLFLQFDGENAGDHVVFIPRDFESDKTDEEILSSLDLTCDGSLHKISVNEALSGYAGRPTFEAFIELFCEEPKCTKLIYHNGHGGISTPGGMQKELFDRYLRFLEEQLCQGMAITSCYVGGESTLNFLSNGNELKLGIQFPVMVHGMGDLVTYADQEAEFSMKQHLEMMQSLIETRGGLTYQKWKEALIKCEDGKDKCFYNQVQVYFPHSAMSPSGFRPLEELPESYSLTMTKLGRAIHEPGYDPNLGLKILPIKYFSVFPIVVDIPISFIGNMPLFFSQFPGPSHHYFSQIFINENAKDHILIWMKEMQEIYDEVQVPKAFFIDKLCCSKDCIDYLVIYIGTAGSECLYKWKDIYFHHDGKMLKHISPLQYALKVEGIIARTTPSTSAELAGTAGQQNNKSFIERIDASGFIPKIPSMLSKDNVLKLADKDYEQFSTWFADIGLRDQKVVLIHLALAFKEEFIIKLIEENSISPDFVMINNRSFVSLAVQINSLKLIKFLLAKLGDLNSPKLQDLKLLHHAAIRGDTEILECILQQKDVDMNYGPIPFVSIVDADLVPLLTQYRCNINEIDSRETSALGLAVACKNYRKVEALVKAGADLNLGTPSPISLAINTGDVFPISLLLKAGAKGFEKEDSDTVPFLECIWRGTPSQVKAFLENSQLGASFLNDEFRIKFFGENHLCRSVTAMDVAIIRKNREIICDLIAAGVDTCSETQFTNEMLELASEFPDLIKKILSNKTGSLFELNLFCAMIYANCRFAESIFLEGLVNSEALPNAKKMILKTICKKGTTTLLSMVKNDWQSDLSYFHLKYALENPKVFQYLLDIGVKFPSAYFLETLNKFPKDLLAKYLLKYPDLGELKHKECLKAAILNKDDDVFIQLVKAGMNPIESGKFFTTLVWKERYVLARYCLSLGLKFTPWECNEIFTELIYSSSSIAFLFSQNLKVHKDELQFNQQLRAFINIIKYNSCKERIKFAYDLGFDPISIHEYDPDFANVELSSYIFKMTFMNFLNEITFKEDSELYGIMLPFFMVLKEKGPEEIRIILDSFFENWERIQKVKKKNPVFIPRSKKKANKSQVVTNV